MQRLHERHPDDVRSLYALAVMQAAHRKFGDAENRLRAVIELKPDWEQPRVSCRATCWVSAGSGCTEPPR